MKTLIAAILGLFVMTTAATAQVGVFVGPNGGVGVIVVPRGGYYDDGYMPGWRGTAVPYFYGGPYWGGHRGWRGHRVYRGHGGWRGHGWRGHHRRHH